MAPDERPRPQYGEYATPQEQAEVIARSLPPISPSLTVGGANSGDVKADARAAPHPDAPPVVPLSPLPAPEKAAAPKEAKQTGQAERSVSLNDGASRPDAARSTTASAKKRSFDFVLSIGLLALALVNLVSMLVTAANLDDVLNDTYQAQDIGTFVATPATGPAGFILAASYVVLFSVVTLVTVRRLRARKMAFWVPLTGGVISVVISIIVIGVLVANDQTFVEYATSLSS